MTRPVRPHLSFYANLSATQYIFYTNTIKRYLLNQMESCRYMLRCICFKCGFFILAPHQISFMPQFPPSYSEPQTIMGEDLDRRLLFGRIHVGLVCAVPGWKERIRFFSLGW